MSLASGEADGAAPDRAEKRPGAFRTITEVAEELAVPQHVLRFWESRFAQIRPIKRAGGRRYYRPEDIDLLKGVRQLLHGQGYTIRGAQRILKGHGIRFVQGVGRGEVQAGNPAPHDREIHDAADPAGEGERPALSDADRAALEAVLADLRDARDLMHELMYDLSRDLSEDGPD